MGERDAVERVDEPVTTASLVEDLRDLGVAPGDVLLVHSSLRSLGWVCGGAQAVVEALREAVTADGTLVLPTHTPQYSDPSVWSQPPVPEAWYETIEGTRPAFRPAVTPTRGMGAIPECFRSYPDVERSGHPEVSFAAWGAGAEAIVGEHEFDEGLGEGSPLARLYERDADVLLLGVSHDVNTSLHLAEYRADVDLGRTTNRAPVLQDGERTFVEYEDVDGHTDDFEELGAAFERRVGLTRGGVGAATARLASQPDLVDFAVEWMEEYR